MGYAGGTKKNPTYHALGDHTESIQIDFDPSKIAYEKLLELFWASHNPCGQVWSAQYKAAVFFSDEAQEKLAKATRDALQAKLGRPVTTTIQKLDRFYVAEDYHQKYVLQSHAEIARELRAIYPRIEDFTRSTAAARLNSWLAGHGDRSLLEKEIGDLGLSKEAQAILRKRMSQKEDAGCGD